MSDEFGHEWQRALLIAQTKLDQRAEGIRQAWRKLFDLSPLDCAAVCMEITKMQSDKRDIGDFNGRMIAMLAEYAVTKLTDEIRQEATDGATQQD